MYCDVVCSSPRSCVVCVLRYLYYDKEKSIYSLPYTSCFFLSSIPLHCLLPSSSTYSPLSPSFPVSPLLPLSISTLPPPPHFSPLFPTSPYLSPPFPSLSIFPLIPPPFPSPTLFTPHSLVFNSLFNPINKSNFF